MELYSDYTNSSPNEEVKLASSCPKKRTGRKKYQETRHPVFRGARLKKSGKWVSEMREPHKKSRIWLGTFPTAEMAARAHDVAALALRGRSACLNFADSAWRLPVPASSDPKDIQRAALEAAESFRPIELDDPDIHSEEDVNKTEENWEAGTSGNSWDEIKPAENAEDTFYMDDEAVFGMPGLIADMAKAMMLSPPRWEYSRDDVELDNFDASLWSF